MSNIFWKVALDGPKKILGDKKGPLKVILISGTGLLGFTYLADLNHSIKSIDIEKSHIEKEARGILRNISKPMTPIDALDEKTRIKYLKELNEAKKYNKDGKHLTAETRREYSDFGLYKAAIQDRNLCWVYAVQDAGNIAKKEFSADKRNLASTNNWSDLWDKHKPQSVLDNEENKKRSDAKKRAADREKFEQEKLRGENPSIMEDVYNKKITYKYPPKIVKEGQPEEDERKRVMPEYAIELGHSKIGVMAGNSKASRRHKSEVKPAEFNVEKLMLEEKEKRRLEKLEKKGEKVDDSETVVQVTEEL